jgi:hypothetical protein
MPVLHVGDWRAWDTAHERQAVRVFDDREMGDLLSEEASAPDPDAPLGDWEAINEMIG